MEYDEPVWRPPSEARSVILQVTLGCSHNRCTFCHMYVGKRFRVRPLPDVARDLAELAEGFPRARRVFLADGDALAAGTDRLVTVADQVRRAFPRLERISAYATPQNLLRKTEAQLARIRAAGVSLVYLGVESGDPEVLAAVDKGVGPEDVVRAAERAHAAGLELSCTVLLGLAGPDGSLRHARATAELLSRIDPAWIGALSIMVPSAGEVPGHVLRTGVGVEPWLRMAPLDLVAELRELLAGLRCTRAVFRANHASNYLPIGGTLPGDRDRMLRVIDAILADGRADVLRPAWMRGL